MINIKVCIVGIDHINTTEAHPSTICTTLKIKDKTKAIATAKDVSRLSKQYTYVQSHLKTFNPCPHEQQTLNDANDDNDDGWLKCYRLMREVSLTSDSS